MANMVITIGREYGSGGHEIGQKLAKELGFSFYDKDLLKIVAEKSGIDAHRSCRFLAGLERILC